MRLLTTGWPGSAWDDDRLRARAGLLAQGVADHVLERVLAGLEIGLAEEQHVALLHAGGLGGGSVQPVRLAGLAHDLAGARP
jgi:hypothetical protein